jgi:hypothetical protein
MTTEDVAREVELGITVIAEKMTVTYEQTIQLKERTKISQALAWLQTRLSREGITGQITTEMEGGGCRRVIVRHVGNVRIGSILQAQIEDAFDKKKE